jgi:two-component system cell cycle response regulator
VTARVLIVDDIQTNVRLLEARLSAEYFHVRTANSGPDALAIVAEGQTDIVLLDVMMPGMDGFEVCERIKSDPRTAHVPVVMITALDQPSDRVRGLGCGADDFLTKPVDDIQLMARVKSLVRLKALMDELRARAQTGQEIAIDEALRSLDGGNAEAGRILLIDTDARSIERISGYLDPMHSVDVLTSPADAALHTAENQYELVIVSMALGDFDALRVCSQIRTVEQSRGLPILLVADENDRPRVVRGLDLGVNDFIMRPLERNELAARVRTQIRRQRFAHKLRQTVSNTLALAVTDELTGLYNRRYFDRHLGLMLEKVREQDRDMAVMLIDMDFFKSVNDSHGHDVGDAVLREFADRLRRNIRGVDLACRFGGEEFVVLMPDTDYRQAQAAAERVRLAVAERAFDTPTRALRITCSVGVALNEHDADTPEVLLKRADVALYRAKREGRNRVVLDAA